MDIKPRIHYESWFPLKIVVGLTGASGAIYGYRLLEELSKAKVELFVIASDIALDLLEYETGEDAKKLSRFGRIYRNNEMMAPTASGSYIFDAMVVAPCTMKTLACIANGISSTLIARTAEVALKERRKLILVPRETPLSIVDIKNMLEASQAGAVILPACPGFYHKPKTVDELVDHVVGKVMDQLGVENSLFKRWGSSDQTTGEEGDQIS
jgi:4-hydroxy-3-polyprenylbenzoate decarboxylase